MTKLAHLLFTFCSLCFAVSALTHIATFVTVDPPGGDAVFLVMLLCFLASALPVSMLSTRLNLAQGTRNSWRSSLVGCPKWMRLALAIIAAYLLLTFAVMWFGLVPSGQESALRVFSSFWMLLFSVGIAVSYSALQRPQLLEYRNGRDGKNSPRV